MLKRTYICILAVIMGLAITGCRNQTAAESAVESTGPVEKAYATEAGAETTETASTEAKQTDESKTDSQSQENAAQEESTTETYVYDEHGNVDIDAYAPAPEATTQQGIDPQETEAPSVDDAGNLIV